MKKTLTITMVIAVLFFVSGCDTEAKMEDAKENFSNRLAQVSIPFEWFRLDDVSEGKTVIPKVSGLTLETEEIPKQEMIDLKSNLNVLSDGLEDNFIFLDVAKGQKPITQHITPTIASSSMNWRELESIIERIGEVDHQWFYSFSLRGFGKSHFKGSSDYIAFVDLNAVNDSEDFHIVPLELKVAGDGKIKSIVQRDNEYDSPHTVKELADDSFVFDNTHLAFLDKWQPIEQELSHIHSEKEEAKQEVEKVRKRHAIDVSDETLISLFSHLKDNHELGFTAYLFDDRNLVPQTHYELTVSTHSGYHTYTIIYDRGKREVTEIKTGTFLSGL